MRKCEREENRNHRVAANRARMYERECDSAAALEYESIEEKASGSLRAVYGWNEREGTRLKWRH